MATGKIKTLFSDKLKTEALFPRTKTSAVSNADGVGLDALLSDIHTELEDKATKSFVINKIEDAIGDVDIDIDLSNYATKSEVNAAINNIDFPVDSVNGKVGAVVLSAEDVGARPNTWLPTAAEIGAATEDDLAAISALVGDKTVSEQIDEAIDEINFPVTSVNGMTGDVVIEFEGGASGWNDLTDKPFYDTEPTYEPICENVEITLYGYPADEAGFSTVQYVINEVEEPILIAGEKYKAIVDGVEYVAIAEPSPFSLSEQSLDDEKSKVVADHIETGKFRHLLILNLGENYQINMYPPSDVTSSNETSFNSYYSLSFYSKQHTDGENVTISIYKISNEAKKLDVKYIDQADWNNTNSASTSYIRNKPFNKFEGINVEKLIFDETVTFEAGSKVNSGYFSTVFVDSIDLSYVVVWDGVRYECHAYHYKRNYNMIGLGNIRLFIDDYPKENNLPFGIEAGAEDGLTVNIYIPNWAETTETHTCQIYRVYPAWRFDQGLVPAMQSDWDETNINSIKYVENRPCYRKIENQSLVRDKTRTFEDFGGISICYDKLDFQPIIGETYSIMAGNSRISRPCIAAPADVYGYFNSYCGNLSIFDSSFENTGETVLVLFGENGVEDTVTLATTATAKNYRSYISGNAMTYYPLNKGYIPPTTPTITSAEAGQVVAVKETDWYGVPTKWEAINVSASGGSWNDLTDKPFYEEDSTVHTLDSKFIGDDIARVDYVDTKVANMVDSAPETLNTLNELARALGEDPNFATTVATQIGTLEDKVGDKSVSEQITSALESREVSWNDLKDKPFGEEGEGATITWDGNGNDRQSFNYSVFPSAVFYKISDEVISIDDILGSTVRTILSYDGKGNVIEATLTENNVYYLEDLTGKDVVYVEDDETLIAIIVNKSTEFRDFNTIVEPGVYFGYHDWDGETYHITSLTYGSSTIKTLDEKFIPYTIARKSDLTDLGGQGYAMVATDPNNDGNIVLEYRGEIPEGSVGGGLTAEQVQAMIDAALANLPAPEILEDLSEVAF